MTPETNLKRQRDQSKPKALLVVVTVCVFTIPNGTDTGPSSQQPGLQQSSRINFSCGTGKDGAKHSIHDMFGGRLDRPKHPTCRFCYYFACRRT